MATNDNTAKRDNRVWLSCPKNLLGVREKLRKIYTDEDIWKLGLIPLAEKHHFLPEGFEEDAGPRLEVDMHVDAPMKMATSVPQ